MVDLGPTILEALGLRSYFGGVFQGKSFVPSLINSLSVNQYTFGGVERKNFSGDKNEIYINEFIRSSDFKLEREKVYLKDSGEELSNTYKLYDYGMDEYVDPDLNVENFNNLKGALELWSQRIKK